MCSSLSAIQLIPPVVIATQDTSSYIIQWPTQRVQAKGKYINKHNNSLIVAEVEYQNGAGIFQFWWHLLEVVVTQVLWKQATSLGHNTPLTIRAFGNITWQHYLVTTSFGIDDLTS